MHACGEEKTYFLLFLFLLLLYYSNTLEVTREDQMKEKKNYFGKPYTQVSRRDPGKLKVDRLKSCIIKSIISVTIRD